MPPIKKYDAKLSGLFYAKKVNGYFVSLNERLVYMKAEEILNSDILKIALATIGLSLCFSYSHASVSSCKTILKPTPVMSAQDQYSQAYLEHQKAVLSQPEDANFISQRSRNLRLSQIRSILNQMLDRNSLVKNWRNSQESSKPRLSAAKRATLLLLNQNTEVELIEREVHILEDALLNPQSITGNLVEVPGFLPPEFFDKARELNAIEQKMMTPKWGIEISRSQVDSVLTDLHKSINIIKDLKWLSKELKTQTEKLVGTQLTNQIFKSLDKRILQLAKLIEQKSVSVHYAATANTKLSKALDPALAFDLESHLQSMSLESYQYLPTHVTPNEANLLDMTDEFKATQRMGLNESAALAHLLAEYRTRQNMAYSAQMQVARIQLNKATQNLVKGSTRGSSNNPTRKRNSDEGTTSALNAESSNNPLISIKSRGNGRARAFENPGSDFNSHTLSGRASGNFLEDSSPNSYETDIGNPGASLPF